MFNFLRECLFLGASAFVFYLIIEHFRMASGKEMLIDRLIKCLQNVYHYTAAINNDDLTNLRFKGNFVVIPIDKRKKMLTSDGKQK